MGLFFFFFDHQIWATTTSAGLLCDNHCVCGTECLLYVICNVCHHEVFHWDVTGRDNHHLYSAE